jgi:hypothetical protein
MKIRHQYFKKPGDKKASVELLTLDQVAKLARKMGEDPREMLIEILKRSARNPVSKWDEHFIGIHTFFHEEKD